MVRHSEKTDTGGVELAGSPKVTVAMEVLKPLVVSCLPWFGNEAVNWSVLRSSLFFDILHSVLIIIVIILNIHIYIYIYIYIYNIHIHMTGTFSWLNTVFYDDND